MMRFENAVVVSRPIDEVFAFLSNPFSSPRRGGGSLGFRVTPPGPIRLGSTIRLRMVAFGLERTLSGVVTDRGGCRAAGGGHDATSFVSRIRAAAASTASAMN